MNSILKRQFRGKSIVNDKFVKGSLTILNHGIYNNKTNVLNRDLHYFITPINMCTTCSNEGEEEGGLCFIIPCCKEVTEVNPKTIGQNTSQTDGSLFEQLSEIEQKDWLNKNDKNTSFNWEGKEIWEGDFIMYQGKKYRIEWENDRCGFVCYATFSCPRTQSSWDLTCDVACESMVVGNIYE